MRDEIIYGIHVVRSLLNVAPERVLEIHILEDRTDKRVQELITAAKQHSIPVQPLSKKQLAGLDQDSAHQGVVARVRSPAPLTEYDLHDLFEQGVFKTKPGLLLVLDQVQDPHNLGACLRSADAAGVQAIIIPKMRSAHITPLVRKAASGAAEMVPCIEVTNLVRCLEDLKQRGIWIVGTSGDAKQSVFETDLTVPVALVLGAEGTGLRRLTAECCDVLMHIPMLGVVESLNVSVAAGVCLYEALRQRTAGKL